MVEAAGILSLSHLENTQPQIRKQNTFNDIHLASPIKGQNTLECTGMKKWTCDSSISSKIGCCWEGTAVEQVFLFGMMRRFWKLMVMVVYFDYI